MFLAVMSLMPMFWVKVDLFESHIRLIPYTIIRFGDNVICDTFTLFVFAFSFLLEKM